MLAYFVNHHSVSILNSYIETQDSFVDVECVQNSS